MDGPGGCCCCNLWGLQGGRKSSAAERNRKRDSVYIHTLLHQGSWPSRQLWLYFREYIRKRGRRKERSGHRESDSNHQSEGYWWCSFRPCGCGRFIHDTDRNQVQSALRFIPGYYCHCRLLLQLFFDGTISDVEIREEEKQTGDKLTPLMLASHEEPRLCTSGHLTIISLSLSQFWLFLWPDSVTARLYRRTVIRIYFLMSIKWPKRAAGGRNDTRLSDDNWLLVVYHPLMQPSVNDMSLMHL